MILEDDVFVGPNVTFTNDAFPRSRQRPHKYMETIVRKGTSIGATRPFFPAWPSFNERTDRGTPVHGGGEHFALFSLVDRGYRVAFAPARSCKASIPGYMEQLRRDYLLDLSASTAYFTLLLVEAPAHRKATLKYLS